IEISHDIRFSWTQYPLIKRPPVASLGQGNYITNGQITKYAKQEHLYAYNVAFPLVSSSNKTFDLVIIALHSPSRKERILDLITPDLVEKYDIHIYGNI